MENENNQVNTDNTNNQNNSAIIEVAEGAWYQDIYVVKKFKFKKEDGTEVEFKPDAVEDGLVIPMLRPDGVPYYQLIDYDTIDFILEQFISKRFLLGRPVNL